MRGKKAKRIRKLIRQFPSNQDDTLLGDNRTARYFYRQPDGLVMKSAGSETPEGHMPLTATYTITRHPGSPRRTYQRVKRMARHG
jgi:hypothetical protein